MNGEALCSTSLGGKRLRQLRTASVALLCFIFHTSYFILPASAQIVALRPDQAAPGMTVVLELLARANDSGRFGADGLAPASTDCRLLFASDTNRIIIGPIETSWSGRLLQVPVFIMPSDSPMLVPLVVKNPNGSDTDTVFRVVGLQQFTTLSGNVTIGEGAYGPLSDGNTIVVDKLIANNATITVSVQNPNPLQPGNPRYVPVTILSNGPIILNNSTISVRAQGVNAGPGGGGGGHGFAGAGGFGFTGGGNCGVRPPPPTSNAGSDSDATINNGGRSITGVLGGGSSPEEDQGGGGGTGAPFGSSGAAGLNNHNSAPGGYGGGSGGGESTPSNLAYGGGGGGFGTDGVTGAGGSQPNNGLRSGGRFLIPLAGGSGGGAGNAEGSDSLAGSGGGGGGAISLITFDSILIQRSSINASGDSGTSDGGKNAAGGGGGSGGAIYLASAKSITFADSELLVLGGKGGNGGVGQSNGGAGGLGRLRMDGSAVLPGSTTLAQVASGGISIDTQRMGKFGNFIRLTGFAPDTINDLDSVRIYYRSLHTNWQHFDTVRSRRLGTWTKWIPKSHDSIEFVMAMIKVRFPSKTAANSEPDWILSHVGMAMLPQIPSPFLVVVDSLDFDTVRLTHCRTRKLIIANQGAAPLRVDSLRLAGIVFSANASGPIVLSPNSIDTIEVTFCPQAIGSATGSLTIYSNDSLSLTRRITLRGFGVKRNDSLVLTPPFIHFARVLVGACDTATVTFRSAGTDTLYLNSTEWNSPPFSLRLTPRDSALAPGATAKAQIIYCPSDSGDQAFKFPLDGKEDSLLVSGHAVLRRLDIESTAGLGDICLGASTSFQEAILNVGNDTITLVSATSASQQIRIISPAVPTIIPAHGEAIVLWSLTTDRVGIFKDTLHYVSADSTFTTILEYQVSAPLLAMDSVLDFHDLCLGSSDTATILIRNRDMDTTALHIDMTQWGGAFGLLDSQATILPLDSVKIRVVFFPAAEAIDSNRLDILAMAGLCDSTYSVLLRGMGSLSVIRAANVMFDTALVGACIEDSMLIENPCGPPLTINLLPVSAPFEFLDAAMLPIVISSGSSRELHFRFCPKQAGAASDTLHIGSTARPILFGVGAPIAKPWAHFTVASATVLSGSIMPIDIRLDSSTFKDSIPLSVTLLYDPQVVWPTGGGQKTASGQYSFDQIINFGKAPQQIHTIQLLGLLGPRASSVLSLAIEPDSLFELRVSPGQITVQDCTGLNGSISVSGAYSLGPVIPTVVADDASVPVKLGNDGYVTGEIFDITGNLVRLAFAGGFSRGSYRLPVQVTGLASGRYFLRVRSLDWVSTVPFLIDK
ncbi:MAG: choice-of-anchor D domain-containing protein [Bacteroidota bacterium]|nr:choice-of-anchor D domain-containing protein [Bacteroidota bacterium]MDP4234496.1 choice-of-anchor D domain-containing protein [Bacteroidota bacterium]MDP4243854.1 choice-of-anchor D domain-containing protein [Bacteroidota bacterium]MDP4289194.1 choice-of-anchor D domain-containing protein [Bacteroidota bacterium]